MSTRTLMALLASSCAALGSTGCGECQDDGDCGDGVFCNGDEQCISRSCVAGTPRSCDDGLPCTADSCDEDGDECVNLAEDRDGDGHFAPGCGGEDCDDGDAAVHPGAEELCDGVDTDCDGVVGEDRDGDGFLDLLLCPEGDDCDDDDAGVYPGAPELCDGVDENCSGGVDDEADTDGDGAEDPTCGGDDCDDEDPAVRPGAPELCNGDDDDCDGAADEDFECIRGELYACLTTCESLGTEECSSSCALSGDPAACTPPDETCDGEDEDCDGVVDNDFPCAYGDLAECTTMCGTTGTGLCREGCEPALPGDCAPPRETCDGEDEDCDGAVDEDFACAVGEDAPCATTCGTIGTGPCTTSCEPPGPEACDPPVELCYDLIDNDCDGDPDCVDEDCIGDISCG